MTNQATVRSTGRGISTNTSTNTCICTLENASIVRTLFDLFKKQVLFVDKIACDDEH